MKRLLVLRHAKSSWHDDLDDFDRPLNRRGKESASLVGQWLQSENILPERILCSSAKRARSTAKRLIKASNFDGNITYHMELYLAAPDAYLRFLKKLPDDVNCAMVVGHNPGLEALVEYLTNQHVTMPTAALAIIEIPIAQWEDIALDATATLQHLWLPREQEGEV